MAESPQFRSRVLCVLVVCLLSGPLGFIAPQGPAPAAGAGAAQDTAAILATPAKSLSTEGSGRTQSTIEAAKTRVASAQAYALTSGLAGVPGLRAAVNDGWTATVQAEWRPYAARRGRAPPTTSLL